METTPTPGLVATPEASQGQTVEVRARIPATLRDQLERLADRNFRSMAGEVAAACSAWVQQHSQNANAMLLLTAGTALLAAAPAVA